MYEIYCKLRDERGMRDADVAYELVAGGHPGSVNI